MKTRGFLLGGIIAAVCILLSPLPGQATTFDFDFFRITDNRNADNPASQLDADVYDQSGALSTWATSILSNEVLFVFTNNVGIQSNIHEIYFDDGTLFSQTSLINSLAGFTDYDPPPIAPNNLPGANLADPDFEASASFGADLDKDGIDDATDALGIVIALQAGKDWDDLLTAIANGDLRLGLHVGSIGTTGGSDSFVSYPGEGTPPPIPEPATLLLLGSGLVGLVGLGRKKFKK